MGTRLKVRTTDGTEHAVRARATAISITTSTGRRVRLSSITHVQMAHLVRSKNGFYFLRNRWCRFAGIYKHYL